LLLPLLEPLGEEPALFGLRPEAPEELPVPPMPEESDEPLDPLLRDEELPPELEEEPLSLRPSFSLV